MSSTSLHSAPVIGSYRVHWHPASDIDDDRQQVIRKAFEKPLGEGEVCHVWVVDAEATSSRKLLSLLYEGSLPIDGLAGDSGGVHYGIFFFLTTRPLTEWDPPVLPRPRPKLPPEKKAENLRHENLKKNEFLIRVLLSHRMGRLVHWDRHDPELTRLRQELERFKERSAVPRNLCAGLQQLAADLETLRGIATRELQGRTWKSEVRRRLSATTEDERSKGRTKYVEPVISGLHAEARSVPSQLLEDIASRRVFADTLRAVYQLGRRPHVKAERELGFAVGALGQRGSILAHRDIDLLVTAHDGNGAPVPEAADLLLRLQSRLWAYELLRDLAYWLAHAANEWARHLCRGKQNAPIRVLILDEVFSQAEEDPKSRSAKLAPDLRERLERIRDAFVQPGGGGGVQFDYLDVERVWPHIKKHVAFGEPLPIRPLLPAAPAAESEQGVEGDGAAGPAPLSAAAPSLFDYDLILVEVEFRGTYAGPAIVEKLNAYMEREAHARSLTATPAIIVLSQTDNFSHVQQCLNLGAVAFVRKERMYELPMRVIRARIKERKVEPQGQKANFRALYSLPHEEVSRLQSMERDDRIMGRPDDLQERRWISSLPKADLHTHIGTFIDIKTIQALAFNTVGHLLDRRAGNRELAAGIDGLIDEACALVVIVSHLRTREPTMANPAALFDRAAEYVLGAADGKAAGGEGSPFHRLVARLKARHHKLNTFEVTAMLVAVLALVEERFQATQPALPTPLETWGYLERLQGWLAKASERRQEELHRWLFTRQRLLDRLLGHISDQVSRRAGEIRGARHARGTPVLPEGEESLSGVYRWLRAEEDRPAGPGADTEERIFALLREPVRRHAESPSPRDGEELRRCVRRVARRVPFAWWKLNRRFEAVLRNIAEHPFPAAPGTQLQPAAGKAHAFLRQRGVGEPEKRLEQLQLVFNPLSLRDLVVIPDQPKPAEKTLLRYLWGTDLLGADHFQYPENLLLAARSIARQSAAENVWHTELRCETVGYTEGGMVAVDATDLLCAALDVAVAYGVDCAPEGANAAETDRRERRWARFNLLLGAKRHKSAERFREIVSLAVYYMQQREEEEDRQSTFAPIWWKPATVAGFDLSGDESVEQADAREMMKPLFKYSTPITIHAGEAVDAESIWQAVYQYGARRIGHGLRLRENRRLLNHCISEGICMELCPSSNAYTNAFPEAHNDDYESDWWEYYPLRYYMEQGLDVCINTDNRQLHAANANSLTDEYLGAARLAGGLSRWEVLRIVKAGFKHAFLPKREIGVLLRAVESEVYELITDPELVGNGARSLSSAPTPRVGSKVSAEQVLSSEPRIKGGDPQPRPAGPEPMA